MTDGGSSPNTSVTPSGDVAFVHHKPNAYGIVHKQFLFAPLWVSRGNIRMRIALYGKQPCWGRSWGWISYYGSIAFSWN
jgi:hypothetical protein